MNTVKIRTNRQVTIPKVIFDKLGVQAGDYVEVSHKGNKVIMEPKTLVDSDDVLTKGEERELAIGIAQAKRGEVHTLEEVRKELGL